MTIDTTTISPSWQVYIPKSMRKRLRLKAGDKFIVVGEGDSIVFKFLKSLFQTQLDGSLPTVTLSPNGQVFIPKSIRQTMGLKLGDRFIEVGERDSIILKALAPPSPTLVDRLLATANKQIQEAGLLS